MASAKFAVGDLIHEVASYPNQVVPTDQYQIVAVYQNLKGYWYVAKTLTGPADYFAVDGVNHYEVVTPAPTKPSAFKRALKKVLGC